MGSPVILLAILCAILAVLALPAAVIEKSWKRFFIGFVLSLFVVVLPLVFFFLSAFLAPEAKDLCHNGPVDCFHIGKLALTPFVLWATAALYAVEIWEVRNPARIWITHGLVLGAIISSVCTAFGLLTHWGDTVEMACLIVPLYTAIWYIARAVHVLRNSTVDSTKLTITLTSSLPFWALSAFWSYKTYLSLPDHPPECFVVTAASRGHRNIVGPLLEFDHRGRKRQVTRQLATLWAFEALWRNNAPRSHATFRRIYNVLGPIVARRITSPWIADIFFLALKPVEFFARFLLSLGTVCRRLHPSQIVPSI